MALVALFPRLYLWMMPVGAALLFALLLWRRYCAHGALNLGLCFVLGVTWAIGYGCVLLQRLLPPEMEQQPLIVEGRYGRERLRR